MEINKWQIFKSLHLQGYNLDQMFLLSQIDSGNDVNSFVKGSIKLETLYFSLYRKGLITEEGSITLLGTAMLDFLKDSDDSTIVNIPKIEISETCFADWWKAYPGTDTFTYKGKSFTGSRSMRVKKDECKVKLKKILEEGEYTIDDLMAALEYEVLQKKESSIKTGANKLTFQQNSLTYLNQRTFEPFIELVKAGETIKESQVVTGGTDI